MRRAKGWWVGYVATWSAICGSALWSYAQGLRHEPTLTRAYLRQPAFVIPFQVDPLIDSPIEVQLFVSQDGGRTWTLAARELPTVQRFSYKAPQDGMYWFTSRTIGRSGKQPETASLRPELLVHIDSRQPEVDLQVSSPGVRQLRATWKAFDPLLDPTSFQLEYRTSSDGPWQPISVDLPRGADTSPTFAGQVEWSVPQARAVVDVRAAVRDRAGNLTAVHRQLALTPPVMAGPSSSAPSAVLTSSDGSPAGDSSGSQGVYPSGSRRRSSLAAGQTRMGGTPHGGQVWQPDNLPTNEHPPAGLAEQSTPVPPSRPAGYGIPADPYAGYRREFEPGDRSRSPLPASDPTPQVEELPAPSRSQPPETSSPSARDQLVSQPLPAAEGAERGNTSLPGGETPVFTRLRRFKLDYDVEAVGVENVAEVQLWVTSDGGRHWTLWGKDADRQSPFEVAVDRDGVYGFRMVIVGDNGLASPKPVAGDVADIWVAVDTAPPVVRITGARYGSGHQSGQLVITWEARDTYLPAESIEIAYGASRQGPWHVIAAGLPNSGEYTWRPGAAMPREVFLKIVAKDEAGNRSEAEHGAPIDLSGLAPRARIRGISGGR